MGLFGSSNTVTKSQTQPWTAAQPYLKGIMGTAAGMRRSGAGFNAPNFQTWAPMSAQTKGALGGIWGAAQAPNALAGQSMGAVSGILGGATDQKYTDLYNSADNPHWADAVQHQSDLIGNDVQRQFSGLGRSGSAADTQALVQQLGDYRTGALSQHWDQNIANQRGILGDQTQGQLSAVAAAPGAYNQQYLPYQMQAQVGSAYDDLAARRIQARTDRFNTNQQAPWNRLNAQLAATTGATGNSSSTTGTVQQPHNPFGSAVGAGILGGQAFGPWGAAIGAGAGFLSGL